MDTVGIIEFTSLVIGSLCLVAIGLAGCGVYISVNKVMGFHLSQAKRLPLVGQPMAPTEMKTLHFGITPLGQAYLRQQSPDGITWVIMATVQEMGLCSTTEIAQAIHLPESKVRCILAKLRVKAWIQILE